MLRIFRCGVMGLLGLSKCGILGDKDVEDGHLRSAGSAECTGYPDAGVGVPRCRMLGVLEVLGPLGVLTLG